MGQIQFRCILCGADDNVVFGGRCPGCGSDGTIGIYCLGHRDWVDRAPCPICSPSDLKVPAGPRRSLSSIPETPVAPVPEVEPPAKAEPPRVSPLSPNAPAPPAAPEPLPSEPLILDPASVQAGRAVRIRYLAAGRPLASCQDIHLRLGYNLWKVIPPDVAMTRDGQSAWTAQIDVPADARSMEVCFFSKADALWDNNAGGNWHLPVRAADPVVAPAPAEAKPSPPSPVSPPRTPAPAAAAEPARPEDPLSWATEHRTAGVIVDIIWCAWLIWSLVEPIRDLMNGGKYSGYLAAQMLFFWLPLYLGVWLPIRLLPHWLALGRAVKGGITGAQGLSLRRHGRQLMLRTVLPCLAVTTALLFLIFRRTSEGMSFELLLLTGLSLLFQAIAALAPMMAVAHTAARSRGRMGQMLGAFLATATVTGLFLWQAFVELFRGSDAMANDRIVFFILVLLMFTAGNFIGLRRALREARVREGEAGG